MAQSLSRNTRYVVKVNLFGPTNIQQNEKQANLVRFHEIKYPRKYLTFLTLLQLDRHLQESREHRYAANLERGLEKDARVVEEGEKGAAQVTIDNPRNLEVVKEARLKLLRTAYTLAMNPTIALSQFKTLVKVQTDNGVRLIEGEHDHRNAKVYITYPVYNKPLLFS